MDAAHPLIGRELGNYLVRSLLGEGGMGAVFMAEHKLLKTRAAIKVLHGSFAGNRNITERFFQEAKLTLEIGHPGIVQVYDFGQSPTGELYLVMELLEGKSLGRAISESKFSEGSALRVCSIVADALAAAHAKGVVHRDLKPDNIFLGKERIKVLDFGIAKVLSASSSTRTGAMLGTPQYMAPEQARDGKDVGPQTDIYALGVILFEMITGRPPFEGSSVVELVTKHLMDAPPKPSQFARVSGQTEALILQCLEKEPKLRPLTMIEVRRRLTSIIPSVHNLSLSDPWAEMTTNAWRFNYERSSDDDDAPTSRDAVPNLSGLAGLESLPGSTTVPERGRVNPRRLMLAATGLVLVIATLAGVLVLRSAPTPVHAPVPTLPDANVTDPVDLSVDRKSDLKIELKPVPSKRSTKPKKKTTVPIEDL